MKKLLALGITAALLAGLVEKGKSRIAIGHPRVESEFREITDLLRRAALSASNEGKRDFAFQVLAVFKDEKKLSIAALSQTLPDRLIEQTTP